MNLLELDCLPVDCENEGKAIHIALSRFQDNSRIVQADDEAEMQSQIQQQQIQQQLQQNEMDRMQQQQQQLQQDEMNSMEQHQRLQQIMHNLGRP